MSIWISWYKAYKHTVRGLDGSPKSRIVKCKDHNKKMQVNFITNDKIYMNKNNNDDINCDMWFY